MKKHLEPHWQDYLRLVVPKDAPPVQIEESRRAFFAGAVALWGTFLNAVNPSTPEATEGDLNVMSEIESELRAFKPQFPEPRPAPPQVPAQISYEVRNPEIEKKLKDIGRTIGATMPPGYGFVLMMFGFQNDELFYISNAERESIIQMMEEFSKKFREN